MEVSVIYKIRDKNTGLYSTGGCWPSWTKTGKTWSTIGHLKQHLSIVSRKQLQEYLDNADLVRYFVQKRELAPGETDEFGLMIAERM